MDKKTIKETIKENPIFTGFIVEYIGFENDFDSKIVIYNPTGSWAEKMDYVKKQIKKTKWGNNFVLYGFWFGNLSLKINYNDFNLLNPEKELVDTKKYTQYKKSEQICFYSF